MSDRPKILLTRRWPSTVEARLAERFDATFNSDDVPMTPEALRTALSEYDAVLPTVTDGIGSAVLQGGQVRARLLANYGAGVSHIDLAAATAAGLVVTNTPDVLSDCTADLAMTLLLMAARRTTEGERELRAGDWSGWRPTHLLGTQVAGKVLGLVGFGRIGRAVARRAHHGFGMTVLVHNRSKVDPEVLSEYGARQAGDLQELLSTSDFVSLHCPGGDANRGLIGARELDWMRPGAFLVNTARGEVIDEAALAAALTEGRIGGAGLDVFDGEPRVDPALLDCPRLVMLPHLGSATQETREAMGLRVMENVVAYFDGKTPPDQIAP